MLCLSTWTWPLLNSTPIVGPWWKPLRFCAPSSTSDPVCRCFHIFFRWSWGAQSVGSPWTTYLRSYWLEHFSPLQGPFLQDPGYCHCDWWPAINVQQRRGALFLILLEIRPHQVQVVWWGSIDPCWEGQQSYIEVTIGLTGDTSHFCLFLR